MIFTDGVPVEEKGRGGRVYPFSREDRAFILILPSGSPSRRNNRILPVGFPSRKRDQFLPSGIPSVGFDVSTLDRGLRSFLDIVRMKYRGGGGIGCGVRGRQDRVPFLDREKWQPIPLPGGRSCFYVDRGAAGCSSRSPRPGGRPKAPPGRAAGIRQSVPDRPGPVLATCLV